MTDPNDVAIVGYGPVGAMTALQLASAGMRVRVFERRTEIFDIPRAVGIDGESMRAFQRLGFGDEVDAIVQPPREVDEFCFTDSQRRKLFGFEVAAMGPTGWRDVAFFDQPQLEVLLRRFVEAREDIEIIDDFEVEGIDGGNDKVVVHGRGPSGEASFDADWLIGCDGASSLVRRSIGAKWESLGYDQDWLVVDIELKAESDLATTMMQVCDPERLTTYIPARDPYRRWEFQIIEGDVREEMLRPERIAELLRDWISQEHYTLRRAAVYQFHAAIASQWRSGRILLAGDAAHQTPPFLGQGLNSGFRDAVALGWKLPLVAAGIADAALLDTYQGERADHSRDLVDRAVGIGQLMETIAAREAGRPDPYADAADRAAAPGGQLVPPIRGGTLATFQVGRLEQVGRQLEQPRVRTKDGAPDRFDSFIGSGFAVVGRSESDLRMSDESRAILERLGTQVLAIDELELVEGDFDSLFEDHPVVLLRPDRIIFGVVEGEHDLDALVSELAGSLH